MSRNYRYGRNYEYLLISELRSEGWYVIRSAGSHSAVDVVALHPSENKVVVYQAKATKDAQYAFSLLLDAISELQEVPEHFERRAVIFVNGQRYLEVVLNNNVKCVFEGKRRKYQFPCVPVHSAVPFSVYPKRKKPLAEEV